MAFVEARAALLSQQTHCIWQTGTKDRGQLQISVLDGCSVTFFKLVAFALDFSYLSLFFFFNNPLRVRINNIFKAALSCPSSTGLISNSPKWLSLMRVRVIFPSSRAFGRNCKWKESKARQGKKLRVNFFLSLFLNKTLTNYR